MKIIVRPAKAFTLMEVLIAMAIFFVAMFSVMNLMSRGLSMARSLQRDTPSPGMIAAELSQLATTNRIDDGGTYEGDFKNLAGDLYKDYRWVAQTYEFASNGLFKADIVVVGNHDGHPYKRDMSVLLFSPRSAVSGGFPGGGHNPIR
ncbi:prepilin-type N-terminal cleavage/methylation domain-containing protein [bacterium]|nr:prepilin-type N-terminal cleavage/methylation domain-containing protein [bacterium]